MVSQIPLAHPVVQDLYTNRMQGPQLDQQAVEVLPFLMNCVLNREGSCWVEGDMLKGFGFDGLERRGDPLDVQRSPPKCQILKFRGLR